jgi:hypothetical protein
MALTPEQIEEIMKGLHAYKTQYDELNAAIKAGKPQGEILVKIGKIDESFDAIQKRYENAVNRLDAIEEKQRQLPATPEPPKSIGELAIEDKGFLAFLKQPGRGSYTVMLKGPIFGQKAVVGISQQVPVILPGVAAPAYPPIGVRTLIPQGRTTMGAVMYVEETSFTNAAAPVAEGAAKPQSDKVFTPKSLPVEVIATYFKASRQSLDDLPFVAAQINNNGLYGVQKAEDTQLLNGNGTSPQLKGLMPLATAAPAPVAASPNLIDAIGAAVFNLAAKGYMADGTVVNPSDWGNVAMLKNAQGNYLFANPMDWQGIPRVWGTRVVATSSMAAGNFLAGAFQGYSQILDREDVNVQVATQNEDDFIKNMVTILVEERLVLIVYIPAAFQKGVVPAAP